MQIPFLMLRSVLIIFFLFSRCFLDARINIEIPLTEDLMQDHGVLNRVLLIYDEIIMRIDNKCDFPIATLCDAIVIIKSFIEDFHEKVEEYYVFPLFKNKKDKKLIKTLQQQHDKGREITKQLQQLITRPNIKDVKNKKRIKVLLQKFVRMYRPHEAREDTVLFPQVRSVISEQEFKNLSEKSEYLEHQLFGKEGFRSVLTKVERIEQELGIYYLEKFTP